MLVSELVFQAWEIILFEHSGQRCCIHYYYDAMHLMPNIKATAMKIKEWNETKQKKTDERKKKQFSLNDSRLVNWTSKNCEHQLNSHHSHMRYKQEAQATGEKEEEEEGEVEEKKRSSFDARIWKQRTRVWKKGNDEEIVLTCLFSNAVYSWRTELSTHIR